MIIVSPTEGEEPNNDDSNDNKVPGGKSGTDNKYSTDYKSGIDNKNGTDDKSSTNNKNGTE